MRRLHPIGKQEQFVASGVYKHFSGEVATGLIEYWSIHEVGGAQFIRVDVDGREANGRSVLYEALRSPEGQIERVDLRAYGNAADEVKLVKASYTFFEEWIEIIRIVNSIIRFEEEVLTPSGIVIAMQAAVFSGLTISQRTALDDKPVLAFSPVYDFFNLQRAFSGTAAETYPVRPIGSTEFAVAGRLIAARIHESPENGEQVHRIVLDGDDIVLEHTGPTKTIRLMQYARRPQPHV